MPSSSSQNLILSSLSPDGVLTLTLSDPDSRNSMSDEMAAEFLAVVEHNLANPRLRLVVLTGAGQAFTAGGNLSMLEAKISKSKEENRQGMLKFYEQFLSIRRFAVPTIAVINGHAIGAGLCLALACDIRLAASHAKLGLNFVHLGLHPGMGATYSVPKIVGSAKAAELLYTGSILEAGEALRLGLVHKVFETNAFEASVANYLSQMLKAGPQAVRELKANLCQGEDAALNLCLEREAMAQAEDYAGAEFKEGVQAAKEKRAAKF